jgi:hypothetical protein
MFTAEALSSEVLKSFYCCWVVSSMYSACTKVVLFGFFAFLSVPRSEVFAPLVWILGCFDFYLLYAPCTDGFID